MIDNIKSRNLAQQVFGKLNKKKVANLMNFVKVEFWKINLI
jgi:hypothetical protein